MFNAVTKLSVVGGLAAIALTFAAVTATSAITASDAQAASSRSGPPVRHQGQSPIRQCFRVPNTCSGSSHAYCPPFRKVCR